MVGNVKGNERETMTGAHLGGRGAGRRRGTAAIAGLREIGGRRGHGDEHHHLRPQRSFFSPNFKRMSSCYSVTKLVDMDHPHRF